MFFIVYFAVFAVVLALVLSHKARVFFVAPKLDQARLCYDAMYQMILQEPELDELAKKRRTDIYICRAFYLVFDCTYK